MPSNMKTPKRRPQSPAKDLRREFAQEGVPPPVPPQVRIQRAIGNQAMLRLLQRKCACGGACDDCKHKAELPIGPASDHYEREADMISAHVMGMREPPAARVQRKPAQTGDQAQLAPELVQRTDTSAAPALAPPSVHEVLRSPGKPLDAATRDFMEPRFGHDFSTVRIHTDRRATDSARAVGARGYTVGSHIVFASENYSPATTQGRSLLAHELTHVVQQTGGRVGQSVQRENKTATPSPAPAASAKPKATDYKSISMHFDGADLIVKGDAQEIFRYSAQSGRPIVITKEHAAQCGANAVTDTYMNDKRFVGITDAGPTPEGTYTFTAPSIERFTLGEELGLIKSGVLGEKETTVHGHKIHSGDWGSGRVPLQPVGKVQEGPCGNANKRSGFFLHGGLLAGSSGCIDIGTHFDEVADFLEGYKQPIRLTIKYEHPPPSVGVFTGLSGAVAYGAVHLRQDPHLRLGTEFAPTGPRGVVSLGYDQVLQWAGGAISAGARLDIPFNDKEAFVRAGLSGGVHFRLLQGLYGTISGGYGWDIGRGTSGPEVGAGLRYDFGRVHLEALYNALHVADQDQRVHQALVGVGFTFP